MSDTPLDRNHYTFCPHCATPLEPREVFQRVREMCPHCGFVHFVDPKVAVVAFVERVIQTVPEVLLVQRANAPERGLWALPAGFVDQGEAPSLAAVREVSEETGLAITITGLLGVWRDASAVIVIGYSGQVAGGTLCAADDALAARWFTADQLPPAHEIGFESTRQLIDRWQRRRLDSLPL